MLFTTHLTISTLRSLSLLLMLRRPHQWWLLLSENICLIWVLGLKTLQPTYMEACKEKPQI